MPTYYARIIHPVPGPALTIAAESANDAAQNTVNFLCNSLDKDKSCFCTNGVNTFAFSQVGKPEQILLVTPAA